MPIVQNNGQFSIGNDCQVVLMGPFGRVDLGNVTGFDAKQQAANVQVNRLDGVQLRAELPKGWNGSFEVERADSAIDDLFANIEAAWYDLGVIGGATIYQYINEADGSTSTYQFDGVSIKLDDSGSWRGDAAVKQRISFEGGRRRRL